MDKPGAGGPTVEIELRGESREQCFSIKHTRSP